MTRRLHRSMVCCFFVSSVVPAFVSAGEKPGKSSGPAAGAVAKQPGAAGATFSATPDQVRAQLELADVELQHLTIPGAAGQPASFQVRLDGQTYTLDLQPHSLRAPDFQLLVQDDTGIHEIAPEPERTYRGVVLDANGAQMPGSAVAGAIRDGSFIGTIDLGQGPAWSIEALKESGLAAGATEHAVYRADDVIPSDKGCGLTADEMPAVEGAAAEGPAEPEGAGPRGVTGFKVADIAFDVDFPAYTELGGTPSSALFNLEVGMNATEFIYERDTDITYEITVVVLRTTALSDPYTTDFCGPLLTEFENEWDSNFGGVRRDLAHLVTGRFLADCAGIAILGTVCSTGVAYGLSEKLNNFTLWQTVMAHEIGHGWNALHCDGNGDCHIMCAVLNSCNGVGLPNFGVPSINQIVAFKNTRTCLFPGGAATLEDPIPIPFVDDFTSSSASNERWIYVDGGLISSNASNEVAPGTFSFNLDSVGPDEFDQDEIRTNFLLLAGTSPLEIEYNTQHVGVENGEDLIVEYWSNTFAWVNLNTVSSDGVDQANFTFHTHLVTSATHPGLFHDEARLRFRVEGSTADDDWYIDNVRVLASGEDINAPMPNPMQFEVPATTVLSDEEILFHAVTATDPSGVQYFLRKIFGAACCGTDVDWQNDPDIVPTGLRANTSYTYRVRARDGSPQLNETIESGNASASTFIETPFDITLVDAQDTQITVMVTCDDLGQTNRCIGGVFTDLGNLPAGLFLEMTPLEGAGSDVWVQTQMITVTGLTPGTDYSFRAKARNRVAVETPFSGAFVYSTTGGGPICPTVPGDIDQDSFISGSDIGGYARAKLGLPPEPGEVQDCADFGTGTLEGDTAAFVDALLN